MKLLEKLKITYLLIYRLVVFVLGLAFLGFGVACFYSVFPAFTGNVPLTIIAVVASLVGVIICFHEGHQVYHLSLGFFRGITWH